MLGIARMLKNHRGQTLVELALVLPVVVLLLAGMMEFGRVFHEYLVVTAAAREGARIAAVGGSDAAVAAAVRNAAQSVDRGQLAIAIEPSEAGRIHGEPITVVVSNPVQLVTPLISAFFPQNPYIVQGRAVMRYE
ncbi:TadE/TadG family type IV pilus assembly protein [Sporolituus thermophilus]|uniref:TadE-like protein n=1 Tax=Sporolituus thermophilus DSM 23256 TaxID=1123285 RepID=A0A1G7HN95_9FIRM|nr:TadE/TadG family type IV pilus assembly protein [Sporolituus thermophilus]SDF01925.1 TadE-like protein [Sporolituus thermophilus DSM 23256]